VREMSSPSEISAASGYALVQSRIVEAARNSGRDPERIRLIGVCKAQTLERVHVAMDAGLLHLGANYLQEWESQRVALEARNPQWHFVGRIQRKKLVKIVGRVALIHSVDRWEVLEEIQKRAAQGACIQDVLIQVNIAAEESKAGLMPSALSDLLREAEAMSALRIRGLMFMPPAVDDPEEARPWFRKGAALLEELQEELGPAAQWLTELSMGMSGDYVQAVEEGATLIRVGTAIFGSRS